MNIYSSTGGVKDIRLIHNELFINIKLLNYSGIRPGGRDELKLAPSAPMSQKIKLFSRLQRILWSIMRSSARIFHFKKKLSSAARTGERKLINYNFGLEFFG